MNNDSLTPQELAQRWKIKTTTLAIWRARGQGPKYYKIGDGQFARVRYKIEHIEAFERKST